MDMEKSMNLERYALEAMIEKARNEGFEAGKQAMCHNAVLLGSRLGQADMMASFEQAATVVAVYRNGDNTVLEFADGSKTKVTYQPEYGYAYDHEKAIMAAMLKRLTGNEYIRALKEFVPKDAARSAANNMSREMIPRHAWRVSEPSDPSTGTCLPEVPDDPAEISTATGLPDADAEPAASTGFPEEPADDGCPACPIVDEDELFSRFGGMAEEPGFDRPLFSD